MREGDVEVGNISQSFRERNKSNSEKIAVRHERP